MSYSPSDGMLDAPVRSESQEDASEEEEEEDDEEEEEEDEGSRHTVQRTPRVGGGSGMGSGSGSGGMGSGGSGEDEDGSTAAATVPTVEAVAGGGSGAAAAASLHSAAAAAIVAVPTLDSLAHLREVGLSDAVSWQLSSAKPGNGVEQLRDASSETYWQSDGVSQPHYIQIHLHRRLPVTHVALYLDYQLDESYTPKTVRVETGMTTQDLCGGGGAATVMELHEPAGWCILPLQPPPDAALLLSSSSSAESSDQQQHVKAHLIRVSVLTMHQNGRDTHVRRLALFCQRTYGNGSRAAAAPAPRRRRATHGGGSLDDEHDSDENENDDNDGAWKHRQHSRNKNNNDASDFATLGMNAYSIIR